MPATEETYRRQPMLHRAFAVTSLVLLLATVAMIQADHQRPWKRIQRDFHEVELDKLRASEREELQKQHATRQAEIDRVNAQIAEAQAQARRNAAEIARQETVVRRARGTFDRLDTATRFKKAELDGARSLYDGYIDRDERAQAAVFLAETIAPAEAELAGLRKEQEAAQVELAEAEATLDSLRGGITELTRKKESLTRDLERVRRALAQKEAQYGEGGLWGRLVGLVRGLPIIDLAAPPTKIQQISLPDLTIDYNFDQVPRYDRCTTCHLGIDRIGYDTTADGKPMRPEFCAHPKLTEGATAIDPKGNVVEAGLYLDPNGPHPINRFGCTICHGGQGSGTTFTNASHTPDSVAQRHDWHEEHNWHAMHYWDVPMLPARFIEASCLKCHHQVTDLDEMQAPKLLAGYRRISRYGCTGCHAIGGEGVIGPDLSDNRPIGPNLSHIASKASREWTARWIRNPHAFRPDTRMPRYYDVANNSAPADEPKVAAEVHAMAHYLHAVSTEPQGFVEPSTPGDPERGRTLFREKGCLACHSHAPYEAGDLPENLRAAFQGTGVEPGATFAPETFPEPARPFASAEFGPNLVNVAAKFRDAEQGHRWLTNWIEAPERYHPKSLMPNLQLSAEDASDIAAWLLSVPGGWSVAVDLPPADAPEVQQGVDELVSLYLSKSKVYQGRTLLLSEIPSTVAALSADEKLHYLGERTIGRLGCFGCHTIPGFEDAKPIGTALSDWGSKSPEKLDFAHITEYLTDHRQPVDGGGFDYDGTGEFYRERLLEHNRIGFLYQKLHRPRSYDYAKTREELKTWDERLRMPQFSWADDPEAIEEVMTFVLGLTGERIPLGYLPEPTPRRLAIARGERLLERYNCRGCHTLAMPRYTIAADMPAIDALPQLRDNVLASYSARSTDYLEFFPGLEYDPNVFDVALAEELPPGQPADETTTLILPPESREEPLVIEGMPIATLEDQDAEGRPVTMVYVQLWQPVTIRGYTFNVGDNLALNVDRVRVTPPDGGDFAWLSAYTEADETGSPFAPLWNRLPPPLIRQGAKVQTPWLTRFLLDPYAIRPAVNLRMPRFHYGHLPTPPPAVGDDPGSGAEPIPAVAEADAETRDLANYFAAIEGAEFPYQDIPQRDRGYLTGRESAHPNYLHAGWQLATGGACVQCHAIGPHEPTGSGADTVNGPDLDQIHDRFRPGYLFEWLAMPGRLVPYTAMPQNIPPQPLPGAESAFIPASFRETPQLDQVRAIRDMLLNYVQTVQERLVEATRSGDRLPAFAPTAESGAGAETGGGGRSGASVP